MEPVPAVAQLKAGISGESAVARLAAASDRAQLLRVRADELVDEFVTAAREEGASWTDIGCALGTSKQAAQQRFAALGRDRSPSGAPVDVLAAAADEARALGHHYVQPEHIVLALVARPEELAGEVLARLGIDLDRARERVGRRLGTGTPRPSGTLGVAPQTKRLLELARAIARSLDHRCPRTEHILLAATSRKLRSSAADLLADCGVEPAGVRDQVSRVLLREAPELAERFQRRSMLSWVGVRGL